MLAPRFKVKEIRWVLFVRDGFRGLFQAAENLAGLGGRVVPADVQEGTQDTAHMAQLTQIVLDLGKAALQESLDLSAWCGLAIPVGQQGPDIGQGQAGHLSGTDEAQPFHGVAGVEAVVGLGAPGWGQETDTFVVTHRRGRHLGASSQMAYGQAAVFILVDGFSIHAGTWSGDLSPASLSGTPPLAKASLPGRASEPWFAWFSVGSKDSPQSLQLEPYFNVKVLPPTNIPSFWRCEICGFQRHDLLTCLGR